MTYMERNMVEAYAVLFDNLSDLCKKALAERLLNSVKKEHKKTDGFELSFGKWEGDNQSMEEIKAEIKANRTFKTRDSLFV